MAKQSENINLTLPEVTDKIVDSIPAMSENFETIDQSIAEYNAHKNNTEIHHTHANKAVLDAITADKMSVWDSKSDVVFGVYTGDGAESRTIHLGFTPVAVEIYSTDGSQSTGWGSGNFDSYGGLALNGHPCGDSQGNGIKIIENGFNVSYIEYRWMTNRKNNTYYFKAYKNGTILEV